MRKITEEKLYNGVTGIDSLWIEAAEAPMEKEKGTVLHFSFKKLAAAAAAAALAIFLSVTAVATGIFGSALDTLTTFFGREPSQVELIQQMSTPLQISDTRQGITVSAEALMSDGTNSLILFTVTREDGTALIPEDAAPGGKLYFGSTCLDAGSDSRHWTFNRSLNRFIDGAPGDTAAHYLGYYDSRDGLPAQFSWAASELGYWTESEDGCTEILPVSPPYDPEKAEETADGNYNFWQLEIPLTEIRTVGSVRSVEGTFTANGHRFAVTKLLVSPLAVTVWFEPVDAAVSQSTEELDPWKDFCCGMSLQLRLKDGRELDLSTYDDSLGNGYTKVLPSVDLTEDAGQDKYLCRAGRSLPEIIPVEDMDCVIFNGLKFPAE